MLTLTRPGPAHPSALLAAKTHLALQAVTTQQARLQDERNEKIIEAYVAGMSCPAIARTLTVSTSLIRLIVRPYRGLRDA